MSINNIEGDRRPEQGPQEQVQPKSRIISRRDLIVSGSSLVAGLLVGFLGNEAYRNSRDRQKAGVPSGTSDGTVLAAADSTLTPPATGAPEAKVAQQVVTDTVKVEPVLTQAVEQKAQFVLASLRESILVIDETKPDWPEKGSFLAAVPVNDQKDLSGNLTRGRSILEIRTGTTDFEWVGGGRYAFIGKASQDLGTETEAVSLPDGAGVIKDKKSGKVIYMKEKNKIVIPGGTDKELRGNLIFVLGDPKNVTATVFEADTASNYREKRDSGLLNQVEVTPDGAELIAAMAKVYVNSMYRGRNCKGNGCRDAVGVYVIRGGDEKSGQDVELLFAAVYTGKELEGLKLKNQ